MANLFIYEFFFIKITTIHTVPIFLPELAENIFKIYFKTSLSQHSKTADWKSPPIWQSRAFVSKFHFLFFVFILQVKLMAFYTNK